MWLTSSSSWKRTSHNYYHHSQPYNPPAPTPPHFPTETQSPYSPPKTSSPFPLFPTSPSPLSPTPQTMPLQNVYSFSTVLIPSFRISPKIRVIVDSRLRCGLFFIARYDWWGGLIRLGCVCICAVLWFIRLLGPLSRRFFFGGILTECRCSLSHVAKNSFWRHHTSVPKCYL